MTLRFAIILQAPALGGACDRLWTYRCSYIDVRILQRLMSQSYTGV